MYLFIVVMVIVKVVVILRLEMIYFWNWYMGVVEIYLFFIIMLNVKGMMNIDLSKLMIVYDSMYIWIVEWSLMFL